MHGSERRRFRGYFLRHIRHAYFLAIFLQQQRNKKSLKDSLFVVIDDLNMIFEYQKRFVAKRKRKAVSIVTFSSAP